MLLGANTPARSASKLKNGFFYEKHNFSGLTVLDPFVGGGTTLVEAAKCGANVIGVDIDPVACFVTSRELEPIDAKALNREFELVRSQVREKILAWYRTRMPDARMGTIVYAFWVDILKCPDCKRSAPAHPHYQLRRDHKAKTQTVFCKYCDEIAVVPLPWRNFTCKSCSRSTSILKGVVCKARFTCPACGHAAPLDSLNAKRQAPTQRMFALEVLPDGSDKRVYKRVDQQDLALYRRASLEWRKISSNRITVPTETIPVRNRSDKRPVSMGYRRYRDLFNDRQLLCLATLARAIKQVKPPKLRAFLALAFSDCLAANNMLCFYAFDYQKLTPLFGVHAYHRVIRPVENNVWGAELGRGSFEKCYYKVIRGKQYAAKPFEYRYERKTKRPKQVITGESVAPKMFARVPNKHLAEAYGVLLNRSSEDLQVIDSKSIDLILTDPPYFDNLPYSELSDFYHVWLKRLSLHSYPGQTDTRTPLDKSLYVRPRARRLDAEHERFSRGLASVFRECYRGLKDAGIVVFTFHHNNPLAWRSLGSAVLDALPMCFQLGRKAEAVSIVRLAI